MVAMEGVTQHSAKCVQSTGLAGRIVAQFAGESAVRGRTVIRNSVSSKTLLKLVSYH